MLMSKVNATEFNESYSKVSVSRIEALVRNPNQLSGSDVDVSMGSSVPTEVSGALNLALSCCVN